MNYMYDHEAFTITEKKNGEDVEFHITVNKGDLLHYVTDVRQSFNNNDIATDVMFYTLEDHEYQAIVRADYYVDFVLSLFKYKVVNSVSWDDKR